MRGSIIGEWYPSPRYLLRKKLLERCLRKIGCNGKSILEIGYGSGDMLCAYHELGLKVYGYDFSELAKEESEKRIISKGIELNVDNGITLFQKESEAYDKTYDVLVACEVLEHIENDYAMLEKWNNSISPNGYLLMSVPSGMKKWSLSDEIAGHFRRYEKKELIEKLNKAGFDIEVIWSYPVPINRLLDFLMNREHRIKKKAFYADVSKENASKLSGINRQSGSLARLLSKPALMYPWHLIQMMFVNTDLGSGYVVMAKKMYKIIVNKKKIFKIAGNVLVVIAVFYLVKKYIDLGIDIKNYLTSETMLYLLPIILFFSVLISIQFLPWAFITRSITESSITTWSFYKVFQRANIMKYIPGNIFQYVGRGEILSENEGANVVNVAVSVIIENIALLIASLLAGFCFVRDYVITIFSKHRLMIISVIVCLAVLLIVLRMFFYSEIMKWIKLRGIVLTRRLFISTFASIFFFFISLMVQALFQILIIHSLSKVINMEMLLLVGGAYSISWLVGYMTPGASGGIGVREAIFCTLLDKYISTDVVIVAVIIFRGVNIIADLIAYSVSDLFGHLFKR